MRYADLVLVPGRKFARGLTFQYVQMCKSQIRNNRNREVYPNMLMPDELHNWLLVIGLYTRKAPAEYRPIGLGSHRPKGGFQFHKLFHRSGAMARESLRKPKVLQHLPYASTGNPVLSPRTQYHPPPTTQSGCNASERPSELVQSVHCVVWK